MPWFPNDLTFIPIVIPIFIKTQISLNFHFYVTVDMGSRRDTFLGQLSYFCSGLCSLFTGQWPESHIVSHLVFAAVCVACLRDSGQSEILELKLPRRLLAEGQDQVNHNGLTVVRVNIWSGSSGKIGKIGIWFFIWLWPLWVETMKSTKNIQELIIEKLILLSNGWYVIKIITDVHIFGEICHSFTLYWGYMMFTYFINGKSISSCNLWLIYACG